MIRVAAFTGGLSVPSARFRVRQYIPLLYKEGIDVNEFVSRFGQYPPEKRWVRPLWALATLGQRMPDVLKSHKYDMVILQREMISSLATLESLTARPRVLDVDDAIYLNKGGSFAQKLATLSDKIICGNSYLADWFKRLNPNVDVIPTAVDTERFHPYVEQRKPSKIRIIGWVGTSGNHKYLYSIESSLEKVLRTYSDVRLKVISDQHPLFSSLPNDKVDFHLWSETSEVQAIQAMDIGIMPLEDSPWARGKCSFKMLQYMAIGLPVVVSPVGMNAEVLALGDVGIGAVTEKQWTDGLIGLLENKHLREYYGTEGRRVATAHYSTKVVASLLARSLRGY